VQSVYQLHVAGVGLHHNQLQTTSHANGTPTPARDQCLLVKGYNANHKT